jgi:ABC-type sugar transport system substrate-binding protein
MKRRSKRFKWRSAVTIALAACSFVVFAALLGGCGGSGGSSTAETATAAKTESTTSNSSETEGSTADVSEGQVQAIASRAIRENVNVESLNPVLQEAFANAAAKLTPAEEDKAFECWKEAQCKVGNGDLTLGIADGANNPWREATRMEIVLQALTYPEIGEIIYTNAEGDVSAYLSNIRNLVAQGADMITGYNDFGEASAAAFRSAQQAGVPVSLYTGVTPGIGTDAVSVQVVADTCKAGQEMVDAAVAAEGKDAKLALLGGVPGNPQDAEWKKCAKERLSESYPAAKVVFEADTNFTDAGVFEAASSMIASGEEVNAVLYSYTDPLVRLIQAFESAGKPVPALICWTESNLLNREWERRHGSFPLYSTSSVNWPSRASVTALMKLQAGEEVSTEDGEINYPFPFIAAKKGEYLPNRPPDFPGNSLLIPESLIERMLG